MKSPILTVGNDIFSELRNHPLDAHIAFAEFCDNSIQSFVDNKDNLFYKEGKPQKNVEIKISISDDKIEISDNAAGISEENIEDALTYAKYKKTDQSKLSLSEFGVGMKNAAFKFSPKWHLITKALNEKIEKTYTFDLKNIKENIAGLAPKISTKKVDPKLHYTHIVLENCYGENLPKRGSIKNIKDHLRDVYRKYITSETAVIYFKKEKLGEFKEKVLLDRYHEEFFDKDAQIILWKKPFSIEAGLNEKTGFTKRVEGWVGVRSSGESKTGGIPLFREDRMILGTGGKPHKPPQIYGYGGSTRGNLRLIGEMNLINFSSSSIKDRAYWGDSEQDFYKKLRKIIVGDKEKFKNYLKKGYNPQNKSHVASLPIEDMYIQNLPTLLRERENRRVAEDIITSLEESGNITISDELTEITIENAAKLNQDKDLSNLIKKSHEDPIEYESGDIDEEEVSSAGDYEIKIPGKGKGKIKYKYSIAPIPSPEATTSGIEELYKIENFEKDIIDVTINEDHSVFSTFTNQESRRVIIRMIGLLAISEYQTNLGLTLKEKGGTKIFRKNINIFSMNTLT